jgi:hypothetical protein
MPHAHDPRPENGAAILALAREVLPSCTFLPIGEMRTEFDRGDWLVKDDRGHVWRVRHDDVVDVVFEVQALP